MARFEPVAMKRRGSLPSPDGLRFVWAGGDALVTSEASMDRVLVSRTNVTTGVRRVIRELRPVDTAGITTWGAGDQP